MIRVAASEATEIGIMQTGEAGEVGRWLLSICEQAGISVTELARRARLSPSTLTRFLKTPSGIMLSGRTLHKLAVVEQEIRSARRADPFVPPAMSGAALREEPGGFHAAVLERIPLYPLELAPSDLIPIEGADDLELIWTQPRANDRDTEALFAEGSPRMFAIYMPGEFMRPRFRAGECLLVDRLRPAAIGSEVFVSFVPQPDGERIATIAELVDRDRNQIRLHQSQHDAFATVHRRFVRAIHPVIGVFRGDIPGSGLQLDLPPMR